MPTLSKHYVAIGIFSLYLARFYKLQQLSCGNGSKFHTAKCHIGFGTWRLSLSFCGYNISNKSSARDIARNYHGCGKAKYPEVVHPHGEFMSGVLGMNGIFQIPTIQTLSKAGFMRSSRMLKNIIVLTRFMVIIKVLSHTGIVFNVNAICYSGAPWPCLWNGS